MNRILGDNPSPDAQMAILVTTLTSYIESSNEFRRETSDFHRVLQDEVGALKLLQREQNSNVANIQSKQGDLMLWINTHDDWHDKEDERIKARFNKQKGRNEVLITEWKMVVGVLSSGIIGALIGKIGSFIGWW